MNKKYKSGVILPLVLFIALGICVYGAYFLWQRGLTDTSKIELKTPEIPVILDNREATPTPFEFNDLTIPHLRQRSYQSTLSLVQKIGGNNSYESHIASYLSDGLKINGLLTIPKAEKPAGGFPAIVFIHGYIPPKVYRTKVNYVNYVDYLAKNGFVVFKIDLRGHDQSEGEPGGAYYSGDYVIDALNAYNALEGFDQVNKEAIGFWGHSMAGNVVFRSLTVRKNIPAAVIWAGAGYTYTDLQEYEIDDNSYRPPSPDSESARKRLRMRELYGSFDPTHWFWQQVPGTNYLDGVQGNLQLNHAVDDNVVSIEYSRNLVRVLDKSDIKVDLIEYQNGGHNISGTVFNEGMKDTVDFFKKHLR